MDRFYGQATASYTYIVEPGSSSLCGPHFCSYRKCSGSFAQLGRFQALSLSHGKEIVARASVCSPECAAAYNRYVLSADDPESDGARTRHQLLEKVYGRRIVPAPAPNRTQDCNRMEWLRVCRAQLSEAEREVADRELVVQRVVPQGVGHIK